jgi:hypothetical protein
MPEFANVNLPVTFAGFGGGGQAGFDFVATATGGSPRAAYKRFNGKTGEYTTNGERVAPGRRYIVCKATAAFVRLNQGEKPRRWFAFLARRRHELPS